MSRFRAVIGACIGVAFVFFLSAFVAGTLDISAWTNRPLSAYLMVVFAIAGAFAWS